MSGFLWCSCKISATKEKLTVSILQEIFFFPVRDAFHQSKFSALKDEANARIYPPIMDDSIHRGNEVNESLDIFLNAFAKDLAKVCQNSL